MAMSKFDFGHFTGSRDVFAVNSEKYSREEAIELFRKEVLLDYNEPIEVAVGNAFVRHRAGRNEDNERCVGWWLEYEEFSRSCPAYVFHIAEFKELWSEKYEIIKINGGNT